MWQGLTVNGRRPVSRHSLCGAASRRAALAAAARAGPLAPDFPGRQIRRHLRASSSAVCFAAPSKHRRLSLSECLHAGAPIRSRGAKRPVMVWFYGGRAVQRREQRLRRQQARPAAAGVIVVTFNFRVGRARLPVRTRRSMPRAIRSPITASWTSSFALQWVQRNIAAFWRRSAERGRSSASPAAATAVMGQSAIAAVEGPVPPGDQSERARASR